MVAKTSIIHCKSKMIKKLDSEPTPHFIKPGTQDTTTPNWAREVHEIYPVAMYTGEKYPGEVLEMSQWVKGK